MSAFLSGRGWPDFDLAGCGRLLCPPSGEMPPLFLELARDPEFRALPYGKKVYLVVAAADHGDRIPEADRLLELIREELTS